MSMKPISQAASGVYQLEECTVPIKMTIPKQFARSPKIDEAGLERPKNYVFHNHYLHKIYLPVSASVEEMLSAFCLANSASLVSLQSRATK